ncbi:MAG: hypothetical protein NZL83_01800 [Candidatus Absconditabacterales bacterium]|nr:hypothetical protein [Candidatus Absconditabacterales bacterium]
MGDVWKQMFRVSDNLPSPSNASQFDKRTLEIDTLTNYGTGLQRLGRQIKGRFARAFGIESTRREYRVAKVVIAITDPKADQSQQTCIDNAYTAFRQYCESSNMEGHTKFFKWLKKQSIQEPTWGDVKNYFQAMYPDIYKQYNQQN